MTSSKRGRCALCGIKAATWANLLQHYGYGQGPGDKAAKRAPRPGEASTAPARAKPGQRPAA